MIYILCNKYAINKTFNLLTFDNIMISILLKVLWEQEVAGSNPATPTF